MRIIRVTVLVLGLPAFAVDAEFDALVLADLAPSINRIPLIVEVTATTSRSVFFDIPTTVSVGHDVM